VITRFADHYLDADQYYDYWEKKAKREKLLANALTQRNARLRALVECLLVQDPNQLTANGVTILDAWRKRAMWVLAPDPVVNAVCNGPLWFWDLDE